MRIQRFPMLYDDILQRQTINNSTLVFDAQNYFYKLYQSSKLHFEFGCECDRYLEFLKKHLEPFKAANVKCLFIFKGGHKSVAKRIEKGAERDGKYEVGQANNDTPPPPPIFMWEIHRQVLEEMGFQYTVCEYEAKRECIALAQKLKCPVVSNDIEFCFSGVPYISFYNIKFDQDTQTLTARAFDLDIFLQVWGVDEDKLATFVVLTDENIFPEGHFFKFMKALNVWTRDYLVKYTRLFKWLSVTSSEGAIRRIFTCINKEDQVKFLKAKDDVKAMTRRQETTGIATEYLENNCKIDIAENDSLWFQKGVASGIIAIPYINLYHSSIIFGSNAIANRLADEPLLLSSDIIKYVYNLLTNFKKPAYVIIPPQRENIIVEQTNISKPVYEAKESVFENGWESIKSLGLFEHFLAQAIPGFNFERLKELPEDAQLLMIALLYFKCHSTDQVNDAVAMSVLLSYVALGELKEDPLHPNDASNNLIKAVNEADKTLAKHLLLDVFRDIPGAVEKMFKPELNHPLVEFQHCLNRMSNLNKLCGGPYKPIVFSKMYNATLVYMVLFAIVHEHAGDTGRFVTVTLDAAPTVLAFVKSLFKIIK